MLSCCFFGHSDSSFDIYDIIEVKIRAVIEDNNVKNFYVGNYGNFDKMVIRALRGIKCGYPQINYNIVLPYLPKDNSLQKRASSRKE